MKGREQEKERRERGRGKRIRTEKGKKRKKQKKGGKQRNENSCCLCCFRSKQKTKTLRCSLLSFIVVVCCVLVRLDSKRKSTSRCPKRTRDWASCASFLITYCWTRNWMDNYQKFKKCLFRSGGEKKR